MRNACLLKDKVRIDPPPSAVQLLYKIEYTNRGANHSIMFASVAFTETLE